MEVSPTIIPTISSIISSLFNGTFIDTRRKTEFEDKRKSCHVLFTDSDVCLFRTDVAVENVPKLDYEGNKADEVGNKGMVVDKSMAN